MELLLFGDQTTDYLPTLQKLLKLKRSPYLAEFLDAAATLIRNELVILPKQREINVVVFSTIEELVDRYDNGSDKNAVFDSTLACLSQLVHFIFVFEKRLAKAPRGSTFQVVGICTGLISAAAAASCDNLTDFAPLALETLRIAFRLGFLVASRASELSKASSEASWSTVIPRGSMDAFTAHLTAFNEEFDLKLGRGLYISSVGPGTTTISGPPSSLDLRSKKAKDVSNIEQVIPIRGPYHAPHIFSEGEVAELIPYSCTQILETYDILPLRFTGFESIASTNTLDVIRKCLHQILREPLMCAKFLEECTQTADTALQLTSVGSSNQSNSMGTLMVKNLPNCTFSNNDLEEAADSCTELVDSTKIAIVGMASRFPGADDNEEFWNILENGVDTHRTIPPDRWDYRTHTDESGKGKNKSHTPYGCFVEDVAQFDNYFFNISPREAAQMDPMQRLALVTAYEAMESAGMVLNRTPSTQADRIATFYGQASDDWKETNTAQNIDTFFITGGIRAFGPGRINYHFGFQGPSYNVDTACSSSLAAIQLACTALKAKECDTVLAGGMNIFTNPDIFAGLSKGHFLSKTGSCKTFDDEADGYCRGEGVGTVIMKRLSDAVQDKDSILGVIIASATNHSAEAISITHPHIETQEALFRKLLQDARVDAHEISYIEMHGTGTQAGDSVEMESVIRVLAPRGKRCRKRDNPLFLGSVKSNIGHGEAVSGLGGLVKVLSMLQRNKIPPHCGVKTQINRGFPDDLEERKVYIPLSSKPWPRPVGGKRRALLNNFGAAGGNTALIIEDGPVSKAQAKDPRSSHIITISGKTSSSFKVNAERLITYIEENPTIDLPSLSYTTTARRPHYRFRASLLTSSPDETLSRLRSLLPEKVAPTSKPPKVIFVFTGQSSQYLGMGKELMQTSKVFRRHMKNLDRIAIAQGLPSFLPYNESAEESDIAGNHLMLSQLALVCLQISLARVWISWGVQPSAVIGHSLGEYAALNIAGILSDFDTVYLVGKRSQLMYKHCEAGSHAMLAIRADWKRDNLETVAVEHGVEISCINSPRDIVVSGTRLAIDSFKRALPSTSKSQRLDVPFAFHSSQVDPILEEFAALAASVVFSTNEIPIISSLYGKAGKGDQHFGPAFLTDHCRKTVDFAGALQSANIIELVSDHASSRWLEIGPHPTCCSMIKTTLTASHPGLPSLSKNDSPWTTLLESMSKLYSAGVSLDWAEYHRDYESSVALVPLPTYSFEKKRFWIDYLNDWTLSKGEKQKTAATSTNPREPFTTTSVQRIVKQDVNAQEGVAVILAETDFQNTLLRDAVAGHVINGVALCPSAIYADMAMTVCSHGHNLLRPLAGKIGMDVRNMANTAPLVVEVGVTSNKTQIVEIEARIDLPAGCANVSVRSKRGQKLIEHANCKVSFEDLSTYASGWNRVEYLINSRLNLLARSTSVSKIQGGMAYRLFSNLVQYGSKFRGMREVLLDSEGWEAAAQVCCQSTSKDGSFFLSPYLIDNLAHISGFVMNANEALDIDHVYISHGWESMKFLDDICLEETYQVYVKMQPQPGSKLVAGDVYVLRNNRIVGLIGQCRFQCVPRTLLTTLLPVDSQIKSALSTSANYNQEPMMSGRSSISSQPTSQIEQSEGLLYRTLSILANEIGCAVNDLEDTALFADLGVDSLLSLTILGKFREVLDLEVDSTLFLEYPSVASLKLYIKRWIKSNLSDPFVLTPPTTPHMNEVSMAIRNKMPPPTASNSTIQSILLHGSSSKSSRNVFLFPDGSGSCASYALLAAHFEDLCVWGMNCPFMTLPEAFTIGIPSIVRIYIAEMRRRQPNGPYIIGGWSAGGILAYEATKQLLADGERVDQLLLIDSPCPLGLEALPIEFHEFCAEIGILSLEERPPDWLLPHFAATVRELTKYSNDLTTTHRATMTGNSFPRTTIVWARNGIGSTSSKTFDWKGRMPNSMQWLMQDRSNIGPNGWEVLLRSDNIRCLSVDGNHFTMMREPIVNRVGRLLSEELRV